MVEWGGGTKFRNTLQQTICFKESPSYTTLSKDRSLWTAEKLRAELLRTELLRSVVMLCNLQVDQPSPKESMVSICESHSLREIFARMHK